MRESKSRFVPKDIKVRCSKCNKTWNERIRRAPFVGCKVGAGFHTWHGVK